MNLIALSVASWVTQICNSSWYSLRKCICFINIRAIVVLCNKVIRKVELFSQLELEQKCRSQKDFKENCWDILKQFK